MHINNIARGTLLKIFIDEDGQPLGDVYRAKLRYHEEENLLIVHCPALYNECDYMGQDTVLKVQYDDDLSTYSFNCCINQKMRSNGLVMLEQIGDIEVKNVRQYERDEIRESVKLYPYGSQADKIKSPPYSRPFVRPDLQDVSFDISAGGMCIVSNTLLKPEEPPIYLAEFSITDKEVFLIPAKLVRCQKSTHTNLGKYDYGFQFLLDFAPEDKKRLNRAIFMRKMYGQNDA